MMAPLPPSRPVILAGVLLLASASSALAQSRVDIPPPLAQAAVSGPVRVIVRVAAPDVAGDMAVPAVLAARQAVVTTAQTAVLSRLTGHRLQGVRRFSLVAGFAAEVDQAALLALASTPGVVGIEADRPVPPIRRQEPAGPQVVQSVPLVQAPLLWQQGIEGDGWTIAVLDSGVDPAHPFLRPRLVAEACYSSNVPSQGATSLCPGRADAAVTAGSGWNCTEELDDLYDDCHHGTHVAGIALGNDEAGTVYGVARGASLLSIQVFSHFENANLCAPEPSCLLSYTSDQVRALERVLMLSGQGGLRIAAVNLSLGAGEFTSPCDDEYGAFKEAVDTLRAAGIPTVVAAGNQGRADGLSAPACVSTVVSVGSTTKDDVLSYFSNRSAALSLLAPGSGIVSSIAGGAYATYSGTSMASPHVAGAWALLKQRRPSASVSVILAALRATGAVVSDPESGATYPRIRIADAAATLGDPSGLPGSPTALQAAVDGTTVTLSWQPPTTGGPVTAYELIAGYSSGADDLGHFPVGAASSLRATVMPGTYYVRVAATNGSGTSSPSAEISFVVGSGGALPGLPGAPAGLQATVHGHDVTLSWEAPSTGGPVDRYVLEAGSASGLSDIAHMLVGETTAVGVAAVPSGTYFVRVRAVNAGGLGEASNEVMIVVP